jgi:hypothetical protein
MQWDKTQFFYYRQYQMLEKPNPEYDPTAIDQQKYETTCSPDWYDSCMYGKLKEFMNAEAGCVVPYLPDVAGQICTDFVKSRKAFDIHW